MHDSLQEITIKEKQKRGKIRCNDKNLVITFKFGNVTSDMHHLGPTLQPTDLLKDENFILL